MPDVESYDPEAVPDPADWLVTSEWDRIAVIAEAHERLGIALPNPQLHATLHCIVENQIALDEPAEARQAVQRLVAGGKSRHDAIHAVAELLALNIQDMLQGGRGAPGEYRKALAGLGA